MKLALLAALGMRDIREMNALKIVLVTVINGVARYFLVQAYRQLAQGFQRQSANRSIEQLNRVHHGDRMPGSCQ
jgi:hypothetical protein